MTFGCFCGKIKGDVGHILRYLALAGAGLVLAACGPGAEPRPDLYIADVWARPAPEGGNGVAYLTIENKGGQADRLLSLRTEVARRVDLHESRTENGVVRMRPVHEVEIPGRGRVEFKPGGLHVMLIGLSRALQPDDTFPLWLKFGRSGERQVQVRVAQP